MLQIPDKKQILKAQNTLPAYNMALSLGHDALSSHTEEMSVKP